jgi:hypothetical protein
MLSRLMRNRRPSGPASKGKAPAVESLETRVLMAVSPVFAGTKIKGVNLSANGISTNQTLITVPFTGNINIADVTKIQLRGYASNPQSATLGQVKKVVNVVSATVLAADHSYLQITTDRLMRKGGSIIFYSGALKDDNGDTLADQTVKTVKGQNKERFTLACRMFSVTNFNRFTPDIFASAATPTTASNTIDETTATNALKAFLDKKVVLGLITQAKEDATMTRYSSAAAKGTIPDHNLRAALFSLVGTFAEGAIASWLDGANVTGKPYTVIDFQDPGDSSVEVAKTTARPSDGRLRTVFRPEFKGEPFQVLSAWVAHEALHQDNTFGLQEEVAAVTFGTLINAEQAQVDNSYLKGQSVLVNKENDKLLALLNSGQTIFPYVGVLDGPNLNKSGGVFAGQVTPSDGGGVYKSFNDYIKRLYIARGSPSGNSPGNALLNSYYNTVTGKTAAANMQFSDSIITDIDAFQSALGTKAALGIANVFRLKLA